MSRFEQRQSITLIAPWRHSESADLSRQGIGEVIAVEICGRNDLILRGSQQHLLKHRIGDAVLNQDLAFWELAFEALLKMPLSGTAAGA